MFSATSPNSDPSHNNLKIDLDSLLTQSCKNLTDNYQKIDEKFKHNFHQLAGRIDGLVAQQTAIFQKLQMLALQRQNLMQAYQTSKLMNQQADAYFKDAFEELNSEHNRCALAFNKNEQALVVIKKDLTKMQFDRKKAAAIQGFKFESAIQDIRTKYKTTVNKETLDNEILFTHTYFLFVQNTVDMIVSTVSNNNTPSTTNLNAPIATNDKAIDSADTVIEAEETTGDEQKLKKTWCSLFLEKNGYDVQVEQDANQSRMASGSGPK